MRLSSQARRAGAAAAVAMGVVLAGADGVGAAPAVPGAEPVVIEVPAGEYCAFPVTLTVIDGQTLREHEGSVIVTGPYVLTVTNAATGASRTVNASGATFVDSATGLITQTGPTVIGQPASRNVGPPFLILLHGRVTYTEEVTIDTIVGRTIDLCAAVA